MSCDRFWDLLDTAALSHLSPDIRAQLEAHAAACPACAQALAAERLLSRTLAPTRVLRPSRSLQEALLAVPRQAERSRRLRALGVFALPVSVLALGLLAFLAPELLRGQRTVLDEARPAAGPSVASVDRAAATATRDLDRATVARPAGSPAAAGLEGGARKVGAASPTPRSARPRPQAPGRGSADFGQPSAPTAGPTPQLAPSPPLSRQRPGPRPPSSPTPAPPEAADVGGQTAPGPHPLPSLPPPADPSPGPTEAGDLPGTASAIGPAPAETPTPPSEPGPPGGGRQPEPQTPEPSPEAGRSRTPEPTPTPGSGDPAQPIVPPSETPTPTPTPSPTPTTTP